METTCSRRTPIVGGKIVKNRKPQWTPYSRPLPISNDPTENPNWLSGFISPAKFIASGASKFLSFFGNHDDNNHSSSEHDDEDDEIENDMSFREDDLLDKVLSPFSKSDNKHAIEQLVMRETYSRKEANELIKLVRSRILDMSGSIGETTPNMHTTVIMEARKWLQERRSGSKKKPENEFDMSNMASPSQISRNEKSSPVDMARSYMQSRFAWASPSSKKFEAGSPSAFGVLHFKEETPQSTSRSSELKKSTFTSGSWNLLDEIRRVRSKAAEELLAAASLTKTILSSLSPESNQPQDALMNKRVAEGAGLSGSRLDSSKNVMQDAAARISQDNDAGQPVELQGSEETAVLNDEVQQLKSTTAENGSGCSASGFAEGQETIDEAQPSEEEYGNLVASSHVGRDIHMENLNPQDDPATDIRTDTVTNGSQDSPSKQEVELSQNFSQPVAKDGLPAKAKDTLKEKKSRGNTRRSGRVRGK